MRILHLIAQLSGGGAERQLSLLAPEIARLGHEVHIAYLKNFDEDTLIEGATTHRLSILGNYDPILLFKLNRLIRAITPDIIHSWILMMDIVAGVLSFMPSCAWIIREPTSEADYKRFNLKKTVRTWFAQRASAIVANSQGGRSYWLRQGISKTRLYVIPNAVPFDSIKEVSPRRNGGDYQKIVIYAGRIILSKNIDTLIRALAEVRRRQNATLLIAGDGPAKKDLMKMVERLGLSNAVRFLGYVQPLELWAYMKASEVFVSLSDYEGMPNSVTEAIACGIPLVLSDIPAHRAFLDDESAVLVPPESIEEVGKGICHILEHQDDAEQCAARAFEAIRSWTPEAIAAQYTSLYERLLRTV